MIINLSGHQVLTVLTALNVAAEQYRKDAATCGSTPRVAIQFRRQETDARELAQYLEEMRT